MGKLVSGNAMPTYPAAVARSAPWHAHLVTPEELAWFTRLDVIFR